jgi:Ca2+-binding EF-hand superfamily protein
MAKIGSLVLVFVLACFITADIASAKGGKKGGKKGKQSVDQLFSDADKDKDGKLSQDEFKELRAAQAKEKAATEFSTIDVNHHGFITLDELKAAPQKGGKKRAK